MSGRLEECKQFIPLKVSAVVALLDIA